MSDVKVGDTVRFNPFLDDVYFKKYGHPTTFDGEKTVSHIEPLIGVSYPITVEGYGTYRREELLVKDVDYT